MNLEKRVSDLENELILVRQEAEKADAGLALFIGILTELSDQKFSIDPNAVISANRSPGWAATILKRMSEGRELIRNARRRS